MAIDMSQFFQVFFEEAGEHLANMESLLLGLDLLARGGHGAGDRGRERRSRAAADAYSSTRSIERQVSARSMPNCTSSSSVLRRESLANRSTASCGNRATSSCRGTSADHSRRY